MHYRSIENCTKIPNNPINFSNLNASLESSDDGDGVLMEDKQEGAATLNTLNLFTCGDLSEASNCTTAQYQQQLQEQSLHFGQRWWFLLMQQTIFNYQQQRQLQKEMMLASSNSKAASTAATASNLNLFSFINNNSFLAAKEVHKIIVEHKERRSKIKRFRKN